MMMIFAVGIVLIINSVIVTGKKTQIEIQVKEGIPFSVLFTIRLPKQLQQRIFAVELKKDGHNLTKVDITIQKYRKKVTYSININSTKRDTGIYSLSVKYRTSKNRIKQKTQSLRVMIIPLKDDPLVSSSPLATYRYAGVATTDSKCSKIATNILAKCGSAVDAAIAALLCSAVAKPENSGLGGGFFMTVYNRESKEATIIDAREMAPAAATEDMYIEAAETIESPSRYGGLAVGVPGDVKGMWEAHQRFGNLPWKELFEEAIELAKTGVQVTPLMYQWALDKGDTINNYTEIKEMITNDNGDLLTVGELQTREKLANTLQVIADEGVDAFYNGTLSNDIVSDIGDFGGIITKDDLRNYKVEIREPTTVTLRDGTQFFGPPPPSSGAVVQFIMAILDGYDKSTANWEFDVADPEKLTDTYSRIIEAFKWGFAKRTYFGDINFLDESIEQLLGNMTNVQFADGIRQLIDETRTKPPEFYGPYSQRLDAGTNQISVFAPNGDAVSVTATLNLWYGSLVKGSRTGIIFNNDMDDFSTPGQTNAWGFSPSESNFIKRGKRMQSSMSPTVVVDSTSGDVILAIGSSGGPRIITSTILTIIHTLWGGKTIKQAIDARRVHHQLFPPTLFIENGIPQEVINGLKDRGHNDINIAAAGDSANYNVVQAVHVNVENSPKISANSDFRFSSGTTDGY